MRTILLCTLGSLGLLASIAPQWGWGVSGAVFGVPTLLATLGWIIFMVGVAITARTQKTIVAYIGVSLAAFISLLKFIDFPVPYVASSLSFLLSCICLGTLFWVKPRTSEGPMQR